MTTITPQVKPPVQNNVEFKGNPLVQQPVGRMQPDAVEIRFSASPILSQDVVEQELSQAIDAFGQKLTTVMSEKMSTETAVFSPASVWNLLMVILNGAEGDTKQELLDVMGLNSLVDRGATVELLNAAQKNIEASLENLPDVTLESGYGVWNMEGRSFQQSFLDKLSVLGAESGQLTPGSAEPVNTWCKNKTKGMIPSILKDEDITEDVNAVLGNALYLKAAWSNTFDDKKTKEETFHGANGDTTIPLMKMDATDKVEDQYGHKKPIELNYAETDAYQAIKLPYGEAMGDYYSNPNGPDNQLYMTVLLPKETSSVKEMLSQLSNEQFKQNLTRSLMGGKEPVELLKMPKFRAEYSVDDLKEVMQSLGLSQVFEERLSNLKGMMEKNADGSDNDSFISKMLQKAVIDVSEEGTEAAAVTVAVALRTASMPPPPKPIVMEVDRPFVYMITDEKNQKPLFIGSVTDLDPEKNKSTSKWD